MARRRDRPLRNVKTAAYYVEKGRRKNEHHDLRGVLAAATQAKLGTTEGTWTRFCEHLGEDPHDYLARATAESITSYLEWYLDQSDIKRQICIQNKFRMIQMLYRYQVGHSMDKVVNEEVMKSIKTQLRFSHALDVGTPHKPVMEVPDLFAFLHFLWNDDPHRFSHERERVQFSLFLLLCAYTSSRPGALVESSADGIRGSGDALRYRDVKLTLIRNPVAGEKDVLVLEITLLLMKGKRHMKEPTTYVLHEQDDNLALCPVLHFLALAFSDNAFKAPDLDCPEAIYQMKVPEPRQAIELEWDGEILNKCIFRRAEKGVSGMKISDRVLPYYSISKHFRKAGQDAGFRENLTPYAIRRATGNAVNSGATEAVRNQVMGHSRGEVFKHYISQSVKYDVQSAYLGIEPRAQLISAAGRMILSRDRRAPTELSSLEKREVDRQDQVVDLKNKRARLVQLCQTKHVTLEQARVSGGILARKFHVADQALKNEVRYQRSQRLKKKKEEFFATINVLEIQNQLTGSPEYCVSPLPSPSQHYLLERTRLACKLFESPHSTSHLGQTVLLRLSALHDLIQLCARQEPRGPRKVNYEKIESTTSESSSSEEEAYPIRCAARTCLFCLGNVALPRQYRQRNFSSGNRLAKHLENQHYRLLRRDPVSVGQIPCPHPACSNILEGIPHFQNHAAKVHGVRFTRSCGQPAMTD